ncbi:MAG: hypothetical protein M0Z42_20625 [Actinomycetota bacterium]|nr:hypothetical protein [Actinomycetota bacterium]
MIIYLVCPSCGAQWRSHASSGKTRCQRCRHEVYVPVAVRSQAADAPGKLVYEVASRQLRRA